MCFVTESRITTYWAAFTESLQKHRVFSCVEDFLRSIRIRSGRPGVIVIDGITGITDKTLRIKHYVFDTPKKTFGFKHKLGLDIFVREAANTLNHFFFLEFPVNLASGTRFFLVQPTSGTLQMLMQYRMRIREARRRKYLGKVEGKSIDLKKKSQSTSQAAE